MEFRTYSTVGHTNSTSAFCLLYSIVQSVRPIHTAEEVNATLRHRGEGPNAYV
jgi:hypothetical protein